MCQTHQPTESLAAFLARVRPGDSCACCGAALQAIHRGPRLGRGGQPGLRTVGTVMCPACGCEIWEESGSDADEDQRVLSTAA